MEKHQYKGPLPEKLYRVHYRHCQTLETDLGLFVADHDCSEHETCKDFLKLMVSHQHWEKKAASPFISVFSDRRTAEMWALHCVPLNLHDGSTRASIFELDTKTLLEDGVDKAEIYSFSQIAEAFPEMRKKLKPEFRVQQGPYLQGGDVFDAEYLILHRIKQAAIVHRSDTAYLTHGYKESMIGNWGMHRLAAGFESCPIPGFWKLEWVDGQWTRSRTWVWMGEEVVKTWKRDYRIDYNRSRYNPSS